MSEPFDFGDVAVCDLCGTSMPKAEACSAVQSVGRQEEIFAPLELKRATLIVCRPCYDRITRLASFRRRYGDTLGNLKIAGCFVAIGCFIVFFLLLSRHFVR